MLVLRAHPKERFHLRLHVGDKRMHSLESVCLVGHYVRLSPSLLACMYCK